MAHPIRARAAPELARRAQERHGRLAGRPLFESLAVFATGVLHLLFRELIGFPIIIVVLACIGFTGYVASLVRRDRSIVARWGFRLEGFSETLAASSVVALLGVVAMAAIGAARGRLALHWHMLPLALLYPIWGLVQQFMIQGLVVANLAGAVRSRAVITLIAAALFGLVHLPDLELSAATFLLGLAFSAIYLRWQNLWPLGLYHGWLGVLLYFLVLGRDPWVDIFRRAN